MSRSLNDLRPEVRPLVDKFLDAVAAAGIDLLVTCTYRSLDDQAALYAQGRSVPGKIVTRAMPGQSAHNYGMAIDVVPIVNGKPEWSTLDPVWITIGDMGEQAGLTWLGNPTSGFMEYPHFELPHWKQVVTLIRT